MSSSHSTLPFCRKCGHEGNLDDHPETCNARSTYFDIGEIRLPDCFCELPCPGCQCEVCGLMRPYCFGASDDWEEACDNCYAAASARGETLSPSKKRVKSW